MPKISRANGPTVEGEELVGHVRTGADATDPHAEPLFVTAADRVTPEQEAELRAGYEEQTVTDLRAECERRELDKAGLKADLVDRLLDDDLGRSDTEDDDTADEDRADEELADREERDDQS